MLGIEGLKLPTLCNKKKLEVKLEGASGTLFFYLVRTICHINIKMNDGTCCKNCGHESHCGITLWKAIDKNLPEIEVCKFCQCEKCTAIVPQVCEAIM